MIWNACGLDGQQAPKQGLAPMQLWVERMEDCTYTDNVGLSYV